MAYIDYTYYTETFSGVSIPENDFNRLADIASDVIYCVCNIKPEGPVLADPDFLKAGGYEVEFLFEQGGTEAIFGRSDAASSFGSESLGNYSVSEGSGQANGAKVQTVNGIPFSPMAILLLNKLGLLSRWLYAYRYAGRPYRGRP